MPTRPTHAHALVRRQPCPRERRALPCRCVESGAHRRPPLPPWPRWLCGCEPRPLQRGAAALVACNFSPGPTPVRPCACTAAAVGERQRARRAAADSACRLRPPSGAFRAAPLWLTAPLALLQIAMLVTIRVPEHAAIAPWQAELGRVLGAQATPLDQILIGGCFRFRLAEPRLRHSVASRIVVERTPTARALFLFSTSTR